MRHLDRTRRDKPPHSSFATSLVYIVSAYKVIIAQTLPTPTSRISGHVHDHIYASNCSPHAVYVSNIAHGEPLFGQINGALVRNPLGKRPTATKAVEHIAVRPLAQIQIGGTADKT